MNDLHITYKKETGFNVNNIELKGEVSVKRQSITFDLEDIPDEYFDPGWRDTLVMYMSLNDLKYIEWLEAKVTELFKSK